jgi:hypothetical protein
MFGRDEVFVANSGATASETFGGETVVIHFERGTYFSLRGSAGSIWSLLQTPTSIAAIVDAARDGSAIDPQGLETQLTAFVAHLSEQDLIKASNEPAVHPALSEETLIGLAAPANLEVFDDLAELITMDPVHEIDTLTGWPHLPQAEQEI